MIWAREACLMYLSHADGRGYGAAPTRRRDRRAQTPTAWNPPSAWTISPVVVGM
jgi:hypothetical protein